MGKSHGQVGSNKVAKKPICISKTSSAIVMVVYGAMEATMLDHSTFLVSVTGLILDSLSINNIWVLTLLSIREESKMVTYGSETGVFQETVKEISKSVVKPQNGRELSGKEA